MRADGLARAVELACQRAVQDVGDERALAAARHAGDRDERPERHPQVHVLQVVLPGADHLERLPVAAPAALRHRDGPLAAQVCPGDRARLREHRFDGPVGDDLAAVLARPRADVDHPVRGPDRLLVVLDDEDRVPEVTQPRQGRDQLRVVPLVQPDRRLVEDVQDAHQGRADLGRQPDPLGFTARQRHARSIEREVVEPDVDEEPEPGDDLLEDLVGDRPVPLAERLAETGHPGERVRDRQRRDVPDVPVTDRHRQDLGAQPLPAAGRTRLADHVLLELGAHEVRVGLAEAPVEVRDDALERGVVRVLAALVAVADDDPLVLVRVEQVLDRLGRQVADRRPEVPAVCLADRLEDLEPPRGVGRHLRPGHEGPRLDALRAVGDDEVGFDDELRAEPGAARAGAMRRVEREVARLQLLHHEAVVRARVALAVAALLEVGRLALARRRRDQHEPLAEAQRGLDRVGQARGVGIGHRVRRSRDRSAARRERAAFPSGASAWRTT